MKKKISANKYAYEYIKSRILNGELKANQKINETKLAQEIEVSRTPLREALRNLEADGLVGYVTNKGVFIKDIKEINIKEVFDLRIMIETYIYLQAYHNIKEENIIELESLIKQMNLAFKVEDIEEINDLFKKYTERIIEIANTNIAGNFLLNLNDYQKIIRNYNFSSINERLIEAIKEQSKITSLFRENNITLFESLVKSHILSAQNYFYKQL